MDPRLHGLPQGEASFLVDLANKVNRILTTLETMSSLLSQATESVAYLKSSAAADKAALLDQIATLKEKLALALANDAADADAIAAAQADAAASKVALEEAKAQAEAIQQKAAELQALADADTLEDSQLAEVFRPILEEKAAAEAEKGAEGETDATDAVG